MDYGSLRRARSPVYLLSAMLLLSVFVSARLQSNAAGARPHFFMNDQQQNEPAYYAESWKKGTRQIQEQRLSIRLDAQHPSYEAVIMDASGSKRYKLIVEPGYRVWDDSGNLKILTKPPNGKDSSIGFWDIKFLDPEEPVSLLVADRDQGHVIDRKNTLASLDPLEDDYSIRVYILGVLISSKRVFKVEGFYCVIKVKHYQLSRTTKLAFEWIEVEIELTNSWKPDTHCFKGKDRAIVETDIARAIELTGNTGCDGALQHRSIASLSGEVRKLQLGDRDRRGILIGNIFDGRLALNKVVDRYILDGRRAMNLDIDENTNVETTVQEYLSIHKADKAIMSSSDGGTQRERIIFLGASYFEDSDQDRAITLIREAAHRAGLKDSDFGKNSFDGMRVFTARLKEKCK